MILNFYPKQYFLEKVTRWLKEYPNSYFTEEGIFKYDKGEVSKGKFINVEDNIYFTFICKCEKVQDIPDIDAIDYKKITVAYENIDGQWEFYYDLDILNDENE